MTEDLGLVFQWWGTLFLIGAAAYPLTKVLFGRWWDRGYLFAKAVGMASVTYLVYLAGTLRLFPFSQTTIAAGLGIVFVAGVLLLLGDRNDEKESKRKRSVTLIWEEAFFFVAFLFWAWVKAHEPSIRGLEKFMDFGFTKSVLNSQFFPAPDMWFSSGSINYYYFGHVAMGVLTKLSGLDLVFTFNLMLATIFALTASMSFSIGLQLLNTLKSSLKVKLLGASLTAFLVTLGGNLQTIYAFTQGYLGDQVKPFWQLGWPLTEFWQKLPEGLTRYWYANATRFIPFTIHEFPSYSFVVSDVHGHVLSLPFALLAIALLLVISTLTQHQNIKENLVHYLFYGLLVGILLMTNALDGPIYLMLFLALLLTNLKSQNSDLKWRDTVVVSLLVIIMAGVTSLPFLTHFQSFVQGLAINCPPVFLENSKIGPFIFEGAEKCQHSPLWMWLLLWGFFLFSGASFILFNLRQSTHGNEPITRVLKVFFFFSLALVIFPEFFYFKDIYPLHFRSNTMFKLGYQAFILFAVVSGFSSVTILTSKLLRRTKKILFLVLFIPLLFLVSIYPVFSVRSYFNGLKDYQGLEGTAWLKAQYPDDSAAINWLNYSLKSSPFKKFAIVEADGDSYTDYARFSAFTGLPTVIGWPVHEWLWRGSYDVVAPRREEVRIIYESKNLEQTKQILQKYHVRYIIVGTLERTKFKSLEEAKFLQLGKAVFRSGATLIYEMLTTN